MSLLQQAQSAPAGQPADPIPQAPAADSVGQQNRFAIMLVGNFLSGSGLSRSVSEELAPQLAARGWTVLTTSPQPGRLARLLDTTLTLWRKRREFALAHVEVYSGMAFGLAEAACGVLQATGKPYILTLHGGALPTFAQRWPWRVRRLLRSARAVTTPSRYLLEAMSPYRADLQLLPNALKIDRYPFRPRRQPRPLLVWLRAFSSIYNPSLAPRVIAALAAEFPEIHLTMVGADKGDGSLRECQRVAQELGVVDRMEWPGAVPKEDVPQWLNRGDIFLNTTNIDNTPVSVLEAMACGLCVVSTDVGGMKYLVEHERDALLAPPADATALASAVRRLLVEPALAERLSCQARMTCERHDWNAVLPQWDKLLCRSADR